MSIKYNKKLLGVVSSIVVAAGIGCGGSSTSNDQGTSFLAYGYFRLIEGEIVPVGGAILTLNPDNTLTGVDGVNDIVLIGVENRLTKQFVRLQRADCDYTVDGSFIEVPSDSTPMSTVLADAPDETDENEAVVGGDAEINPNRSIIATPINIVSADLAAFLNNNKAYLPQLPYRLTASCSVTGVTQAGDVITTNSLGFFINLVEESECCTGAGPGTGVGTGGVIGGGGIVATPVASPSPSATASVSN
jgi:hypothetical protein